MDASPNGSELLVVSNANWGIPSPLWALPIPAGAPRRVGEVLASGAAWSTDGQQISYTVGSDLYLSKSNGSDSHKIATVEGQLAWPRLSPDGNRLRFTVVIPRGTHPLCGKWRLMAHSFTACSPAGMSRQKNVAANGLLTGSIMYFRLSATGKPTSGPCVRRQVFFKAAAMSPPS